ncbi:hypothetical protein D3C71_1742270 [compost metagenome]
MRGGDRRRQLFGQFALLVDRFKDGLTAVFQFTQITQAGFQLAQLGIVQTPGDFLTIACNKGHGITFIQQTDGGVNLLRPGLQFCCNNAAQWVIHKSGIC